MLDRTETLARAAVAPSLRRWAPALPLLCLVGLALRIAAARGNLWLDEVWSFTLVEKTTGYADIVFRLPYDNNHVLNSLWLRFVGAAAPAWLVRAPAVAFGVACIPVAARLGARVSPLAGLAAAAIVAVDYPFVHFSSEARGYSGLILGMLVALDALEARLADARSRTSLLALALAVAFGTFSHLMMLEASTALCLTAAVRLILSEGLRGAWPGRLAPILVAVAAGTAPAVLCLAISLASGPLHTGLSGPFDLAHFAEGLGGLVRMILGVWDAPLAPTTSEALLPLLGLGVIATLPLLPAPRRVLPVVGLLGLPLLHMALHLPNQAYARFHLVTGVCLALYMAELWSRAWQRGRPFRRLAIAAALAFALGQIVQLSHFLAEGRGNFAAATALMTATAPTRLAVLPPVAGPETAALMRWYAKRAGATADIVLVPDAPLCTTTADWVVGVVRPDDAAAAPFDARPCAGRFTLVRRFPAYGMSGFAWTVLRRHDPS